MPCRRTGVERLLLLERAPAVALASGGGGGAGVGPSGSCSKEVDALVAKLGEVLQLSAGRRAPPAVERSPCRLPPKHHSRDRTAPYSSPRGLGFLAALPRRHSPPSLVLLTAPTPPDADAKGGGSPRVAKQLCGRGWLRGSAARVAPPGSKKRRHYYGSRSHPLPSHALLTEEGEDEEDDDDPHRLLQQLILSGNLIKEAVRRLQLAATTVNAAAAAATPSETTSTTGSAASSTGSCCHSSGGERDSGAAALVPALP